MNGDQRPLPRCPVRACPWRFRDGGDRPCAEHARAAEWEHLTDLTRHPMIETAAQERGPYAKRQVRAGELEAVPPGR